MSDLVERVAAELWRTESVDSGSPASITAGRTPEAFADEADVTRAKWSKFARAVVAMVLDEAAGHVQKVRQGKADSDLRSIIHCIRALSEPKP
jgi:hypothetical protein